MIIFTSPSVLAEGNKVNQNVIDALLSLHSIDNIIVVVVSNHHKPIWFDQSFIENNVPFYKVSGRQNGEFISRISDTFDVPKHDFIVFGGSDTDIQMAKNGGAVFVPAGWIHGWDATEYGIAVKSIDEFKSIINLSSNWPGKYFFEGEGPWYKVWSLSNVSGYQVSDPQKEWANNVVNTVKNGGLRLQALLTVLARSLLMSGMASQEKLMWGVYPSSSSKNDDSEVLSDLTHRLRTVASRVQFAKRGKPLFIRHKPSTKRSTSSSSVDRTNPAEQIETLHINPFYRSRIKGRNVVVLDDFTTHGVSFGVASALLRKAGAASVNCIALGKFGNQLKYYEIEIDVDPFEPINKGQYKILKKRSFNGTPDSIAQNALIELIS